MKRTGAIAVLAAVLLAACSSGSATSGVASSVPPKDIPQCDKIYVEDKTIESKSFGLACLNAAGDLVSPVPVRLKCDDDRWLVWNDLAWGYIGEPMELIPEDQATKMPEADVTECSKGVSPLSEIASGKSE